MTLDYDPAQRAGHTESFPCGCLVEDEHGHLHPCAAHEAMALPEAKLWALLQETFPDLPDGMQVYDPNEDGAD